MRDEVALTVTDTATETLTTGDADEHTATTTAEDADGDPIAEATVTIGEHTAETNADGIGTVALEAGEYTVTIEAPGFESTSETLPVAGGDAVSVASLESTAEADDVALSVVWPGVAALVLVGSVCYRLRAPTLVARRDFSSSAHWGDTRAL
ncbi:hypothetical protein HALLA_13395 [Halostagnicola larsenii XH-48]|uniref:PEGA domain-containing protein n=1 Tax=Halostagnicola larsenii XH-48 TaxID=797299 RepID=W0JUT1_9EURY|nr:carboxypeptidase-like regulatory domain-containing protein [Halostagnicola larsenii]AHG01025.1 hypothetical protein HALLA_13395 [Halostagnicola larsenii XH-48]